MKKKGLKIAALVIALLIVAGIGWFANALVGNPVSKWLATRTAERYLQEQYKDTDFEIETVGFNFKNIDYYVHVMSPSSEDSRFSLRIDMVGRLLLDTYESSVLQGSNTANRLYLEYRELTDEVFEGPYYPFTSFIAYGDLRVGFDTPDVEVGEELPAAGYVVLEELVLDKKYNIRELGALAGRLVVYVEDEVVTIERAAQVLLELKELFDTENVPFYAIDFVLEYPRKPEGGTIKDGQINVEEFLYSDIYEDGLEERLSAANDALNAYYAEKDKERELMEQTNGGENE